MLNFGIPDVAFDTEFRDPDRYLLMPGQYWLHRDADATTSISIKYDKGIQEKLRILIESEHPKNSVLSEARSVKKTILPHVNHRWVLHVDIEDYYKNINFGHVEPFLRRCSVFDERDLDILKRFYFVDDELRKGLSASPMISEIVGMQIDNRARAFIHQNYSDMVNYSRYYDDLIFSSNQIAILKNVEEQVKRLLSELGFKPNARKTKIFLLNNAKLLGLRIHDGTITVPKKYKHLLRAKISSANDLWHTGETVGWTDEDTAHEMQYKICSVLGTLQYIIDNNSGNNDKYRRMLEVFRKRQTKIDKIIQEFHEEESILLQDIAA